MKTILQKITALVLITSILSIVYVFSLSVIATVLVLTLVIIVVALVISIFNQDIIEIKTNRRTHTKCDYLNEVKKNENRK